MIEEYILTQKDWHSSTCQLKRLRPDSEVMTSSLPKLGQRREAHVTVSQHCRIALFSSQKIFYSIRHIECSDTYMEH